MTNGVVRKLGSPFRLSMMTSSTLTRIQPIRITSNSFPAGVSDSKMMTYNFRFSFSSCKKRWILSFSFILTVHTKCYLDVPPASSCRKRLGERIFSQSPIVYYRPLFFSDRNTYLLVWEYRGCMSFRSCSLMRCRAARGWHHGVVRM